MITTPIVLRTNLSDSPVTKALKDGRVTSSLVQFDFCGPRPAHDGFKDMVRDNVYDAGELAIVTCLQARSFGKPYVLLPVPVVGRLQHERIGFNQNFGNLSPKDIEGRKVGVRTYAQTTGLWVRGVLQHDYDVDLNKVTWVTIEPPHVAEAQDPPNCERLPEEISLPEMLLKGEIAAAILGNEMPKEPYIHTLIPNPHEAAAEWHRREGIIPINHMFVIHEEIAKQRPDVVREVFRMLVAARDLASDSAKAALPPIGLEANRKGLEMAIRWSFEQKLISRALVVDELFSDTTAALAA